MNMVVSAKLIGIVTADTSAIAVPNGVEITVSARIDNLVSKSEDALSFIKSTHFLYMYLSCVLMLCFR